MRAVAPHNVVHRAGWNGHQTALKQRAKRLSAFLRISDLQDDSKAGKDRPQVIALPSIDAQELWATAHRSVSQAQPALKNLGSELLLSLDQNFQPLCMAAVFGGGLFMGLSSPTDSALPAPVDQLSSVFGWTYFLAWGLSFYPQVYENWRRQSVQGLSFDYIAYGLLGFVCYTIYTSCVTFSPDLQSTYSQLHAGSHINVQPVDLLHCYNALLASGLSLLQFYLYGTEESMQLSSTCKTTLVLVTLGTLALSANALSVTDPAEKSLQLLALMYMLSYVKVGMTTVSYLPQAVMNWKRRSTEGWNMGTVYLDLAGGVLCNLQVLLVCMAGDDWSVITGNPAKTAVGCVCILFDLLFFLQHFVLYPQQQQQEPVPVAVKAGQKRARGRRL